MRTQSRCQNLTLICVLAWSLACGISGCRTRTVLVPDGSPVRIREATRAKVWVPDAGGKWVEGEVVLPEGWYALPDPGPEGGT